VNQARRKIFVAYPWRVYSNRERYKRAYTSLSEKYEVDFVFAEDSLSARHVLQKIGQLIAASDFGIYDITGWNPNVALEYGLALGLDKAAFIAFNPDQTDPGDVPSDVRGFDRLQYGDFDDLKERLEAFLENEPEIDGGAVHIDRDRVEAGLAVNISARGGTTLPTVDLSEEAQQAWVAAGVAKFLGPLSNDPVPSDPSGRSSESYTDEVKTFLRTAYTRLADEARALAADRMAEPIQFVVENKTSHNFSAMVLELELPAGLHAFFSAKQAYGRSDFPKSPLQWGEEKSFTSLLGNQPFRGPSPEEDSLIDDYEGCRVEYPAVHLRPAARKASRSILLVADSSLAGQTVEIGWNVSARSVSGVVEGALEIDVSPAVTSPVDLFFASTRSSEDPDQ
jgi:hypothetical protein